MIILIKKHVLSCVGVLINRILMCSNPLPLPLFSEMVLAPAPPSLKPKLRYRIAGYFKLGDCDYNPSAIAFNTAVFQKIRLPYILVNILPKKYPCCLKTNTMGTQSASRRLTQHRSPQRECGLYLSASPKFRVDGNPATTFK